MTKDISIALNRLRTWMYKVHMENGSSLTDYFFRMSYERIKI